MQWVLIKTTGDEWIMDTAAASFQSSILMIGVLKDLVLTAAAVTGAYVAIKGLGTWRRQLRGQSEYELSRRILLTLFKYREAMNGARNPVMWAHEMPSLPREEAAVLTDEQVHFFGVSKAYQNRWDKVLEQRRLLDADLLESEVMWSGDLRVICAPIFKLESELAGAIRRNLDLRNPDKDDETKTHIELFNKRVRDVLYEDLGVDVDPFKKDLSGAVIEVEKYLKPKLRHGKL